MSLAFGRYLRNAKFILLRLPSLIVADYIMLNCEHISAKLTAPNVPPGATILSEANHLNFLMSLVLAKFAVVLPLFVCVLVFTLNKIYVWRIYKIVSLLGLPFLFRFLVDSVYRHDLFLFEFRIPKSLLLVLVYVNICLLTILIYNDIYRNFITDKHKIYSYYQLHRNRGNEVLTNFIDILSNQANTGGNSSSDEQSPTSVDTREQNEQETSSKQSTKSPCQDLDSFVCAIIGVVKFLNANKRALYIITYSIVSFYVNEIPNLVNLSDRSQHGSDEDMQPLNIISLGYLLLLTYDLAHNFEQIMLRILIQLKLLGRLISQYGLNNFLSFNWFERLKVPYFLRLYFCLKIAIFTANFFRYKDYYLKYDVVMSNTNSGDQFSLYNIIVEWLRSAQQSRANRTGNEDIQLDKQVRVDTSEIGFVFETLPTQLFYTFVSYKPPELDFYFKKETIDLADVTLVYARFLVLNLSNTLISIACTTSILSYQFYLLGIFVNKITGQVSMNNPNNNNNNNNPRRNELGAMGNIPEGDLSNVGDVAAVLFFLLSVQSGITYLSGLQRVEKLLKNYSLLFIAILHYFHTSIDTQLMSLSASSKPDWRSHRHLRVLGAAILLIIIPVTLLVVLWLYFEVSTWLLAASAFNIELVVKTSVSIILYALFLVDSRRLSSAYDRMKRNDDDANNQVDDDAIEKLDEYIYSVKAFGHTFEFITAVFLFFNGAYILLFESYGIIRAVMMVIHAYFHIWCQAIKGWSVFIRRRTARAKLKRLTRFDRQTYEKRLRTSSSGSGSVADRTRSRGEIENDFEEKMHDVCAICFCELSAHEALITQCNHVFHTACLRKWLYLQDTCPMCHQVVYENY